MHRPGVSVRLPATSIVQIPSSVHCMPLPERPGALKRISTFPGRLAQPRLGVGGVSPCCAHTGFDAMTAPPAAAARVRKSLRFIVVIAGLSELPPQLLCARRRDWKTRWLAL